MPRLLHTLSTSEGVMRVLLLRQPAAEPSTKVAHLKAQKRGPAEACRALQCALHLRTTAEVPQGQTPTVGSSRHHPACMQCRPRQPRCSKPYSQRHSACPEDVHWAVASSSCQDTMAWFVDRDAPHRSICADSWGPNLHAEARHPQAQPQLPQTPAEPPRQSRHGAPAVLLRLSGGQRRDQAAPREQPAHTAAASAAAAGAGAAALATHRMGPLPGLQQAGLHDGTRSYLDLPSCCKARRCV